MSYVATTTTAANAIASASDLTYCGVRTLASTETWHEWEGELEENTRLALLAAEAAIYDTPEAYMAAIGEGSTLTPGPEPGGS